MNRRLDAVTARALRYGLEPGLDADVAACELAGLADGWLLEQARLRILRGLVARPSPVGERSCRLLERALVVAIEPNRSRGAARARIDAQGL